MGSHSFHHFDTFKPMIIQMNIIPAMSFCDRIVRLRCFIRYCLAIGHGLPNTNCFNTTFSVAILGRIHLAAIDSFESNREGQVGPHRWPVEIAKRGFSSFAREDAFLQLQFNFGSIPIPVIVCTNILECDKQVPGSLKATVCLFIKMDAVQE